ncbi:MAG: hypothetical protein E5W96_15320 [Mesorhizobium sp.]|nr:MAG: hypothetical protein E5W96_15320 [Mesorhizobium sp.]
MTALQKRALKTAELAEFVAAVGRKSSDRHGYDPNDRKFDPDFAKSLRRMHPEDFDRLLQDDED